MTDQPTDLRDRIAEALDSLKGTVHHLAPKTQQAVQEAVMAALTVAPRTDQTLAERIAAAAIRLGHPRWDADDLAAAVLAELPAQPVVPVSSPPPDQTALRGRIAEALLTTHHQEHGYHADCVVCAGDVNRLAAAVLAVLPPSADRAAAPVSASPPADYTTDPSFVPPAAEGFWPAVFDSATDGASALDAWARTPHGRNFLAHALAQLARDGWLRTKPGEGFEPVHDRDDTPEPQDPAELRRLAAEAQQQAPWATDSARIGRVLMWSHADIGSGDFGRGYRAAQEEARAILTRPLRGAEAQQPDTETQPSWTPGPVALARAADWATKRQDATVDPAMCPRCKGDNSEAFELCAACANPEPPPVHKGGNAEDCPGPERP